ncbi:MAG: polyprenyl synthetase family protein [Promethearchaeota archaeon]
MPKSNSALTETNQRSSNNHRSSEIPFDNQSMGQDASSASSPLQSQDLQKLMILINQEIQQYLQEDKGEPQILYEAAHHLIIAGGKRLRSLLTLLCCQAVNGDTEKVLPITVATELLQTASLIHDDIIDDDEMRRGVQTVHRKFGKDLAILAGDLLIAQAFRIVGLHGTKELIVHLGSGGIRMCEGEAADLSMSVDKTSSFNKQEYISMIKRKTVAFMKYAAKIGAIMGGATEDQQQALMRYAEMLGFAFQLRDDILDVKATLLTAQKSILSDLRLQRGNYPVIHTLEVCSKQDHHRCTQAFAEGNLKVVLEVLDETDAIQHTHEMAQIYVKEAKQGLQGHGFHSLKLLEQFADFVLEREF